MDKKYIFPVLLFIGIAFFMVGCTTSTSTPPTPTTTATVTHWGFDFSTNTPTNGSNSDGQTIVWAPEHSNPAYLDWTYYRWWRSFSNTSGINYSMPYGAVELNTITRAPSTWEMSADTPLLQNWCYVSKCNDGYVKFKVTAVGTNLVTLDADWPATVEYYFSTSSYFDK